jgi:hypothetical protein
MHEVIREYVDADRAKAEPGYKTELAEERRRREQLERRVDELIQENEQSRKAADQAERSAKIREELQRLGVTKVDLGFKAVKDDIYRAEDGRLVARGAEGETSLEEHLARFARDNPELLPARIPGGSGASGAQRSGVPGGGGVDLDKIKPGMDPEELARARREIAQAISHSVQGT